MLKNQQNLQDMFLNMMRKDHLPITIYLISGVQLKGVVKGFDSFTILLDSPVTKIPQIVYKHAIASIVPANPIDIFIENGDENAE